MSKSALIFTLFAFAAGGAIGYVAGTSGGEAGFESNVGATAPRETERRVEDRGELAPPPLPERTVRELVRSIPVPESETGNGVITGHVRLQDGTPLPGAVVRATPFDSRGRRGGMIRGGPAPDQDVEDLVRTSVERLLVEQSGLASTRSGPGGAFTLRGLRDTQHRMQAWRDGYLLTTGTWRSKPGSVVDFVGKPVVRVQVAVLEPDGTTHDTGVSVMARMGGRTEGQWWTPESGAVALEPGIWMLYAQAGDNQELRSEEVEVSIEEGVSPEPVTLRLDTQPGIRGRVRFPPGDTQGYCQVKAIRFAAGREPEPERLLREGHDGYAHAGSGGVFALQNLPPGTYLVGLIVDHREVGPTETVVVGTGIVELDLEFPVPDPADCLVVRVEGPDGKLVADANFQTGYRSKRGSNSSGSARATRLEDGRYRIRHYKVDPDRDAEDGRHYLLVVSARYGTKQVEYARAATAELTVRFDEPAMLTVTVLGYAGSDYEGRIGLSVQAKDDGDSRRRYMSFSGRSGQGGLSPEGEQTFGPLAPGEYAIYLNFNESGRSTSGAEETVTLESGENRATIAVPKLYSLTVVAAEAKDGTRMYLRQKEGRWSNAKRTKDGRAVFEAVPAGEYILSGRAGDLSGQMEVLVPGQSVVRFAPRPINAFLVSITDADGGFARAGLRDGDLVIGVDGEEFTGQRQMSALLTLARQKDVCTFTVLRGRTQVAIKIALKENRHLRERGGGPVESYRAVRLASGPVSILSAGKSAAADRA